MAAPLAGAAKLGDTATRPMPKPTSAAMKIARIFDSPCVLERRRPSASHVLAFGYRVLRSEIRPGGAAFIRRSACRQIAPYRDDKRHWLKSYALHSEQCVAGSFIACSLPGLALTLAHGSAPDSPSRRRRRGDCAAGGAGGALSAIRALHHHRARAARCARRAQAC